MTREEKTQLWISRIDDYRTSGESVASWCERHQVTPRQLNYWLRKFKQAEPPTPANNRPQWIALNLHEEETSTEVPPIHIKVGGATIQVRHGFEPTLLADVVRTLKTLC